MTLSEPKSAFQNEFSSRVASDKGDGPWPPQPKGQVQFRVVPRPSPTPAKVDLRGRKVILKRALTAVVGPAAQVSRRARWVRVHAAGHGGRPRNGGRRSSPEKEVEDGHGIREVDAAVVVHVAGLHPSRAWAAAEKEDQDENRIADVEIAAPVRVSPGE